MTMTSEGGFLLSEMVAVNNSTERTLICFDFEAKQSEII